MDVTSKGSRKEWILYREDQWIQDAASYTLLSSPWSYTLGAAYRGSDGHVQHANVAPWGARPALYH